MNEQKLLTGLPTRKSLPIRAIGSLNKRELLNLCVEDLHRLLRERQVDGVLLTHCVLVLRRLNFGLVIYKRPKGVVQVFDRRLAGQPLSLDTLPKGLIVTANNQFV